MASRFPFPVPNGWFRVGFADELVNPGVRPLRYFGKDLVLAVFEDGKEVSREILPRTPKDAPSEVENE